MDREPMLFRSSRNYKMGAYIFNHYKKRDFIILLLAIIVAVIVFSVGINITENLIKYGLISGLIVAIPAFLTLPMDGYHAMYYRIGYLIKFMMGNHHYTWKGREDNFEEILKDDEY